MIEFDNSYKIFVTLPNIFEFKKMIIAKIFFSFVTLLSYGESVTYMNDEANLEEASKEVLIKLNE